MLTEKTTREEFLQELRSATQNLAVEKHIGKVETMSDEEWEEHRGNLIAKRESPEFMAAKARIKAGLKSQGIRFR